MKLAKRAILREILFMTSRVAIRSPIRVSTEYQSLWDEYCSLVIRRAKSDEEIWIRTKRATAEFFGWNKHFEEQRLGIPRIRNGRVLSVGNIKGKNPSRGGRSIYISRAESTTSTTARKAHRLRLHSRIGVADLAELAHFTEGEWYWMTALNGQRWDVEQWARIYALAG